MLGGILVSKVIAINGSPRKNNNTATLIGEALKGAHAAGADTSLIHLYDLQYKGCISCFSCKRKGQIKLGKCFMKDDLSIILDEVMECDALILGSPIYLSDITGAMRSFMERLYFSNLSYDSSENRSVCKKSIPSAFIYTMGVTPAQMEQLNYSTLFKLHEFYMALFNGKMDRLISTDAYQFDSYADYAASNFDETHKAKVRMEQFPIDCKKAYELNSVDTNHEWAVTQTNNERIQTAARKESVFLE